MSSGGTLLDVEFQWYAGRNRHICDVFYYVYCTVIMYIMIFIAVLMSSNFLTLIFVRICYPCWLYSTVYFHEHEPVLS